MVFVLFEFYVFLAAVLLLYYLLPLRFRWYALLAGSVAFYWYVSEQSLRAMTMLFGAAVLCWFLTLMMIKCRKGRKIIFVIDLLTVILPLLAIKELPFFEQLFKFKTPEWWIIPIGIAFYSMQLIAYAVDVYKGDIRPEKNVLKFILFVSFFPQILQGPIPRYSQLSGQLIEGHRFDEKQFVKGFMLILWGFFLKFCIADKAGIIVNTVFDNYPAYQGCYVAVAAVLYSFQLYADFLACTSFAQGTAGLFGIKIIDNFNHPYFSISVKDFWRRWHISLSTWLRDYIYIPLGGNRKGRPRKYCNLMVTFAVSGIWHGAGLQFLFWGMLHGFYQIMGDVFTPLKKGFAEKVLKNEHKTLLRRLSIFITFILVTAAWVIFRADSLQTGLSMLGSVITVFNPWILSNAVFGLGLEWKEFVMLLLCLCILFIVSRKQERGIMIRERILKYNLAVRWLIFLGAIVFIMIFGTYGFGFDAQAFIYVGF